MRRLILLAVAASVLAVATLGALRHQIRAQAGRRLDPTLAQELIDGIGRIELVIGAPEPNR